MPDPIHLTVQGPENVQLTAEQLRELINGVRKG